MMGTALAHDLVRSPGVKVVTVFDAQQIRLQELADRIRSPLLQTLELDLDSPIDLPDTLGGYDCVISAAPFRYNLLLAKAAVAAGAHFCDLGGNDDVVEQQLRLDQSAREANVLIVPNCGLAPGLANVLAAGGAAQFDRVDSIQIRVGGLPRYPRPPLNYQLVFSVEGLVNEYTGKAKVLRGGEVALADTLTDIEAITFPPPFNTLEAFHTSGGASRLPELLRGRVRELDYKTIRYPGHAERFRALLELGFGSSEPIMVGHRLMTVREMFFELLKKKLAGNEEDVTLLRVTISGEKEGKRGSLVYERIDYFDRKWHITSMGRMTAYPTSVIAQLMAAGVIRTRGAMTPEECVPLEPLLRGLQERGIEIAESWRERDR